MIDRGEAPFGKSRPAWLGYASGVGVIHLLAFSLLLIKMRNYPQLLGFAFLAYTLGLRHAFDVDHIVAIDNVVRKLVQQKENPAGAGFFFSLGHATVVCAMALITAFSLGWAEGGLPQLKAYGGIVATTVSGTFLILIGVFNLFIWLSVYRLFKEMRRGKYEEEDLDHLLASRGFLSRIFKFAFRFINKSWHVYPLGFLFGFGFDTASEIALIAVSASVAFQAMPMSVVAVLPLLFAAGMTLMDTADGVFMTTAYNWAFANPLRKIYYNLSVTGMSVVAALVIGLVELLQLLTPALGLNSGIWGWIQHLSFGSMGYLLVVLFVISWAFSYGLWRVLRLEEH